MPIGNGDLTSSVWVDDKTGDLRLLVSKSDVFDENSQPVKTGVLRLSYDPPLGGSSPSPSPPRCKIPAGGAPLAVFTQHGDAGHSIICDQRNLVHLWQHSLLPCDWGFAYLVGNQIQKN